MPGLSMELHAASASESNADELEATLYFRYMDQPMLAAESRTLTVRRDESGEFALIRALLEGPAARHIELNRLFPEAVQVESVAVSGDMLFVTFNEALISNNEIPEDWKGRAEWAEEAPLLRRLAIQSIVASITETFHYTGVQILVSSGDAAQTSLRLDNSYFLSGQSGPSDPQLRDESVLLTPQNTARCILNAWQRRNFETLFDYTSARNADSPRPVYENFLKELDPCPSLSGYALTGGSVSLDGQRAVVTVSLSMHKDGIAGEIPAYPLHLVRENGLWKVAYTTLQDMMMR